MYKWLLLALLMSPCLGQDVPLGIITSVSGDAQVLDAGAKKLRAAELADVLHPGTRLVTGGNGSIGFVFCPEASAAVMESRTSLEFNRTSYTVKSGAVGQPRRVPSCRIPLVSAGGAAHVGGVNMRGQTNLLLVSPVGVAVALGGVEFTWKPVEGATFYRIALRNDDGEEFWEGESAQPALTYDPAERLAPGSSYRWRVTALRDEEVLSSASAGFRVLNNEEMQRVQELKAASMPWEEQRILLGMLYEELNMPQQALEQYQQLKIAASSRLEAHVAALRARLAR